MNKIFDGLNSAQEEAVKHIDGPMLILAGAGSGKTKTIISRLAYLLSLGIDPANTLTLTFTNKAATQMRYRALNMLDAPLTPPLLVTFHKFGLLFLKFHISKLNRDNNFVVIDSDDKKRIIKSFNSPHTPSSVATEISNYKNSILSPEDAAKLAHTAPDKELAQTYKQYEDYLVVNNLVDFDDLLILTYKILELDEQLAYETSEKYKYIMVDEYQDTNEIQYKLLQKLSYTHHNLCVVGDDDQSIYGWRGANIDNILNFNKELKGTKTVKLETNYRSTSNILNVANELIAHNRNRLGKKLLSHKGNGESVKVMESLNEQEESLKIAKIIKKLLDSGENSNDIAILYRINALSRGIEEGLNKEKITYKLVGGFKFYERSEIKDLISYFRLIVNNHDDFSFKRVINKPKRGIGKVTLEKLQNGANILNTSVFDFLDRVNSDELNTLVGKKNSKILKDFISSIEYLKNLSLNKSLQFLTSFEEEIQIKSLFKNQADENDRVANIDEFYGYYKDYIINNPDSSLEEFLNDISLQSDQDLISDENISLMSIHASKGLEFKHIFIIGLEEGFFPMNGEDVDIEEERRLGYVSITRAMNTLYLCHARSRLFHGKRTNLIKSRFFVETGLIKGSLKLENNSSQYKKGDLIKHKIFGMGKVEESTKTGQNYKLKINFGGIRRDILSSFVEKI